MKTYLYQICMRLPIQYTDDARHTIPVNKSRPERLPGSSVCSVLRVAEK